MRYVFDQWIGDRHSAPRAGERQETGFGDALAKSRDPAEEGLPPEQRQRLTDLIRERRNELDERTWHLRSLVGRFMQLTQLLVTLLGQAQAQTAGLQTALGLAQSLLRRAERERDRAGSLDAAAQSLQAALEAACRETEQAVRELHLNGRARHAAHLDLSAVQTQMQALEAVIQALLAEIAALLSQARA